MRVQSKEMLLLMKFPYLQKQLAYENQSSEFAHNQVDSVRIKSGQTIQTKGEIAGLNPVITKAVMVILRKATRLKINK